VYRLGGEAQSYPTHVGVFPYKVWIKGARVSLPHARGGVSMSI